MPRSLTAVLLLVAIVGLSLLTLTGGHGGHPEGADEGTVSSVVRRAAVVDGKSPRRPADAAATLRVHVLWSDDGAPVRSFQLEWRRLDDAAPHEGLQVRCLTSDGTVHIEHLLPGRYRVRAMAGEAVAEISATVPGEIEVVLPIAVERTDRSDNRGLLATPRARGTVPLDVRVRTSRGAPSPGATVVLCARGVLARRVTDGEGLATFPEGCIPGASVRAEHPEHGVRQVATSAAELMAGSVLVSLPGG